MADPKQAAVTKFGAVRSDSALSVIERYATDVPLAIETLLSAIGEPLPERARICELGFGQAWLLEEMSRAFPTASLVGLDMSAPFVARAREVLGGSVSLVRGDMDRLPFADRTFDVIATCWTLYFMRDIDATLREIRRCLRPRGRVVAATVAPDHMHELQTLVDGAVREVLGREPEPDISVRFDLTTGEAFMRRNFRHVELRDWRGEMVLPDVETALLLWPNYGPQLADASEDAAARAAFEHAVRDMIARDGALRMTRHDGAFVAHM